RNVHLFTNARADWVLDGNGPCQRNSAVLSQLKNLLLLADAAIGVERGAVSSQGQSILCGAHQHQTDFCRNNMGDSRSFADRYRQTGEKNKQQYNLLHYLSRYFLRKFETVKQKQPR